MIFKQETIKSWFTGINSSINNEVVKPFQNAEQIIWKYNQAIEHNSLTQNGWNRILAQSDDSLKMYLTSIKGTAASITEYTTSLQGNITGFKKVSSAITQYNSIASTGTANQTTFANAVSATNNKLGNYLVGLNGAKASIGGYALSLIGATSKTIALQFATIALNSAITFGTSLIISGIVSAISSWIHKTENMISTSEDALDTVKSLNEELKNNQKTISDTAKRFAELSQGVDQLTGKNISLTSDDYEEFLNLSNQLAEMFPTLTRNYNDNGDAIVQLSGNVDTIVSSLHNLIEAQRDLTNKQIAEELPTIFDGLSAKSDAYETEIQNLEDKKNAIIQNLNSNDFSDFGQKIQSGLDGKYFEITSNDLEECIHLVSDYESILKNAELEFELVNHEPIWNGEYDNNGNQILTYKTTLHIDATDEDIEKAKLIIDGKIEELAMQYKTDIQKLNDEINATTEKNKANWNNLSNSIFSWLSTDDSFKVMNDAMQATIQSIINSLDWSSLNFSSWEDAEQYIQNNILSLFNTAEGNQTLKDVQIMLGVRTQFNNGDISVKDYQDKIQELLANIEGLPDETKKSIMWLFGVNFNEDGTTTSDTDTLINNVKEKLQDDFYDKVGELTLDELHIAAEQVEIPEGTLLPWDELIAKIKEVQNSTSNFENPISSTITSSVEQLAAQLEPQFAKLGEAYREIFTADGFTLDAVNNSMLENLRTAFTELEEEVGVAFDASVLNPFFDTLTNKASTVEQVQDAFNNLASAYFYSTETLDYLSSETADAIEKQLEEMGIQNAAEVVAEALTGKTEELIATKEYLAQTGKELANATEEEQTAFILEQIEAGNCGEALALLQLKKLLVNSAQINTSADIQQIMNLASASGMGAEVLTRLANAKNILEKVEAKEYVSPASYQKALSDVESAKQTMLDWKPVELDFSNFGGSASNAGNAGKSAAESYLDAFEEELSDLSQLRDNGVITEKEYLDSLRALYERYFANKLGYEKEYAKYQRQYLEGYKSLYESALSGISTLLGNQIDGYNDAKDAAISSLTQEKDARLEVIDAQKEQLEAQKDLIDEQIEAKQKLIDDIQNEIDAMKEANSERQRQLDLQKAQYELERMQHQRTILQYSEENGMQYVQNEEGLRAAKESVDSAKFEIEISNKEKNISLLEDEISLLEEQKDAIQNQMDLLDKQAEQVENYYSKMISETEAYYDSLINNMERQKSKWEEIAEIESVARAYSDLEQVAGGLGYSVQDILNGNEQAFEDFKTRYITLLSDLNNNSSFSEGLSYATSGIAEGLNNLETSAATVSKSTGIIAANIGEVNTSAETLSGSLSNIGDAISGFSETDNITAAADAFSKLGQAIQSVADALNISEEGTIGSLTDALKSLCEMPLCETEDAGQNGGILSKFQTLKTVVTDVTNAISGGGSSASADSDGGNSSSTGSGAAGNSSGGLVGAIDSLKSAANDALGGSGNNESEEQSEGSGIIAQFGQLKAAVTDTAKAIGSGDSKQQEKSKGGRNGNLISSITTLGSTASEILTGDGNDEDKSGGVIGRFEQFKDVIGEANEHVTGIATGLHDIDGETVECTIKVNIEQNGELPSHAKGALDSMNLKSGEYKAKHGRALAKGTGNNKGLPKAEKNALRSEYGQPELTVYPDGATELTTQPTISDLPRGTVVFNEAQTKEIFQNKPDTIGSVSSADTARQSLSGKLTLPPPQRPGFLVQQELQEECLAKTGSLMDKILSPLNMLSRSMQEMSGLTGNINHVSHNGQNQSVNVGGITITCPGVTSQEVARQVGTELNHIFSGFHNYADQQSRVRN